ncbi:MULTISPECIES: right-handed parallel beta-helix repeat-containing protein [unclassified Devosia]|jgi:poly(beta-D-mannuronate) C5 epimerase|uniref:right-handed parallel beta-helix repeat-containing protein n=1 Tax=unclassified Devosia TaxID=196773 RepID=UPI000A6ECCDB|nr:MULTISPECIES: right-handed parallel beta-helix repeat-containing protein [unclassified Devosia]MBN9361136.1 right-handed parallel beta-helix repeat-containing protein [Devosia sp.]
MRRAWVCAGLAAAACSLPWAATGADYARTLAYEKTVAALAAMVEAGRPATDLQSAAAPLGFSYAPAPPKPAKAAVPGGVQVSVVSIDLVLSQLALQAGANYHVALRQAQARPEVLLVEAGVTSLAQLYDAVAAAKLSGVLDKTDQGYVAHLPIAVWNGATLALQPGETLLLDRSAGAFLLTSGNLVGDAAAIAGTGAPNPRLTDFNPFVVVALSGSARLERMRFADLGYGQFPPLTGVTILEGGFYAKPSPSVVRDSRFEHVGSLALVDADEALVEGNVFAAASGPALLLSGGKDISARGNVVLAGSGAHGIKVTGGANSVELADNIVIAAGLNGIFADAGAANLRIEGNLIAGSKRSGISIASADCIEVASNLLLQNAQSGLAVRDSAGLKVSANRLIDNGNAGISVTHQPDYGVIEIAANQLDGNRVGIKGSTTARLQFAMNDFTGQAPRLLDGELVQFTDRFFNLSATDGTPTIIDGLQLKAGAKLTPTGALRPTSCTFEGDA